MTLGSFFHHFIPWSLEIGLIMIVLELALGVAILIFWRMKWTGWTLLLLMLFFTFSLLSTQPISTKFTDLWVFWRCD